jgi:hypothetical protein
LLSQKAEADLEREKKAESHEEEEKKNLQEKIDFCFFRVHCSQNCK